MGGCMSSSADQPVSNPKSPVELSNAPLPFRKKYDLNEAKELGSGAFSIVRLAKSRINGEEFAVKCIEKKKLLKEDEDALHDEVRILGFLAHPNIIRLYDFYSEPNMYYMVTELMTGGELFDRIVQKTFYNEKEARDLVRTLLDAISYCHDHKVVHRDLKPENLLLKSKDNDLDIKIADFGFAKQLEGNSLCKTQCGTPGYVSPEILRGDAYGCEVDMWSIGVITYILLGGYPPFHDENQANLYRKIQRGDFEFHDEYWGVISHDAKDLIKKMLTVDAKLRLTSSQALRHPWFLGNDHELLQRNLENNLRALKKFNARRKLRGAVKGIMLVQKMSKAFGGGAKKAAAAANSVEQLPSGENSEQNQKINESTNEVSDEKEEEKVN